MNIEELLNEINNIKKELEPLNVQYEKLKLTKEEHEKKLESTEISSVDREYSRGVLDGVNPRFESLNSTRNELLNQLEEKTANLEIEKEKEKILNNTQEENEKYLEKINKEIKMAENNCKEISEEIEYYETRLKRESFEPAKKQEIIDNIKILEEKCKKELEIIGKSKLKLERIKAIVDSKYKDIVPSKNILNIPSAETKDVLPESLDTIPEGKRIIVASQPKPQSQSQPQPDPNPPIEVISQEKKPNFFSKHKKAILIAAGLATLATFLVPPLAAAMMYGNSVLWGACANIPVIGGMAQAALHAANMVLSPLAGALGGFNAATGVWTAASGYAMNAGVAAAGIGDAIGALMVNGTITTTAVVGFRKLAKKLKGSFKKQKGKEEDTPTIPTDKPIPTPSPTVTPVPENKQQLDINECCKILNISDAEKGAITIDELNAKLLKINSAIVNSNDKDSLKQLKKLMEAYKIMSNKITNEMKKTTDEPKEGMVR